MRHLAVDSYGRCLNNRTLEEDHGRATLREVIRRYRFPPQDHRFRPDDEPVDPGGLGSPPEGAGRIVALDDAAPAEGDLVPFDRRDARKPGAPGARRPR